jgi:hypothetical protein
LVPSIELDVEAAIGSLEVTVAFEVPPEFADGEIEIQARLRPTLSNKKPREGAKQAPKAAEPFRFQANIKNSIKETLILPEPLADGKLEVRMLLIKEGKGALAIKSIVLKSS